MKIFNPKENKMKKILLYITFILLNTLSITANCMDITPCEKIVQNSSYKLNIRKALKNGNPITIDYENLFTEKTLKNVKTEYLKEAQDDKYSSIEDKKIIALTLLKITTNEIIDLLSYQQVITRYLTTNKGLLNANQRTNFLNLADPICSFYRNEFLNATNIIISGKQINFSDEEIKDYLLLVVNNSKIQTTVRITKLQSLAATRRTAQVNTKVNEITELTSNNNCKSIWVKRLTSKTVTIVIPITLYAIFSTIRYFLIKSSESSIDMDGAFIYITATNAIASMIISSLNLLVRSPIWLYKSLGTLLSKPRNIVK